MLAIQLQDRCRCHTIAAAITLRLPVYNTPLPPPCLRLRLIVIHCQMLFIISLTLLPDTLILSDAAAAIRYAVDIHTPSRHTITLCR